MRRFSYDGAERCDGKPYGEGHLNDLEPAVHLWDKVHGTSECDGACAQETIVQGRVLSNALAERTAL